MSLMNILASGNENTKPFFENIKFLDRNERYKPIEPTWRPSANKLFRRKFLGDIYIAFILYEVKQLAAEWFHEYLWKLIVMLLTTLYVVCKLLLNEIKMHDW